MIFHCFNTIPCCLPGQSISVAPFAHFRIIRIHFWPTGSKRHFVRLILWKVCCLLSVFHCVSTCYIIEWEFNVSHNAVPIEWVPLLYKNRTPSYYKYSKRIWCFVLCLGVFWSYQPLISSLAQSPSGMRRPNTSTLSSSIASQLVNTMHKLRKAVHLQVPCVRHIWAVKLSPVWILVQENAVWREHLISQTRVCECRKQCNVN